MNVSTLIYLIAWDMRRNAGLSFDGIRAKIILIEFRVEQFVYSNIGGSKNYGLRLSWYLFRFLGSIFQWFLCNSKMAGSLNIGRGLRLPHPQNIIITNDATIGEFATIYQNVTIAWNGFHGVACGELSPKVGNNVLIGTNAIIIGNIAVGDNVLIGAGAVITQSIPNYARVTNASIRINVRQPSENAAASGSQEHMNDPYSIYR